MYDSQPTVQAPVPMQIHIIHPQAEDVAGGTPQLYRIVDLQRIHTLASAHMQARHGCFREKRR